jgi:hypothetical protein
VLVGGLAFGGVAYGTAASLGTWYQAVSDGRTGDAYDLGQKMIAYLHRQGFKQELPYFWYRQTDTFEGLQSLYYYSYTFIGTTMPEMTADFMFRMHLYRPTRLVLMCSRPRCNGALARLARSAYRGHVVSRGLLRAGALRMWLVLYRLDRRPAPA